MNFMRSKIPAGFVWLAVVMSAFSPAAALEKQAALIKISVSPKSAELATGETLQFTAQVAGGTTRKVRWLVNDIAGGNAQIGTISTDGVYTAPNAVPANATVVIKATSRADDNTFGTATVTIRGQLPVVNAVSPNPLTAGAFTLTVSGKNFVSGAQVILNNVPLNTTFVSNVQLTATGTASQAGVYPLKVANPGSGAVSGDFSVQVMATPAVSVTVSPSAVSLPPGGTQQFSASVSGTANQTVVWAVNNVTGGSLQTGTISGTGLYTAPNAAPAGAITVTATSVADNTKKSSATVALSPVPPPTASVSRFLNQTTFGTTPALKTHVEQIGFDAFLSEQFALSESAYSSTGTRAQTIDRFWSNMFKGNDQLRQRTVYALSQIWVESFNKNSEPEMIIPWLRILSKNAFGNYRTLMKEMTLDASMGHYLDLVNSSKPDGTNAANENYPRELMQLFTIGLYKLNADGSLQLDAANQPVPVYSQSDVRQIALALTGWTYPTTPGQNPGGTNGGYYPGQMEPRQNNHDTTAKSFLGGTLPAGRTIQEDLDGALDIIFNHPNVAPFVATRLIRAFVTSNPSPAYVQRISAVFENNGSGVRGDLKAVIRALLLDPEARNDNPDGNFGRLRSPVQQTVAVFRALNANLNEPLSFTYLYESMGEGILDSPSVFGHYSPLFRLPNGGGLLAPEFQIYTATESVNRANFICQMLYENRINISEFTNVAGNSANLINAVDQRFLDGQMTQPMRDAIAAALQASTDNKTRAMTAIYLVITSGDYTVQR